MRRPWQLPLAWALAGLVFAVIAIFAPTFLDGLSGVEIFMEFVWMSLPAVTATAALLILIPRPGNPIGWVLMLWAAGMVLSGISAIPLAGFDQAPESPGFWLLAATWFNWSSWVLLIYPIYHLLLIFPTGHLPSPRWRWLVWLEVGSLIGFALLTLFSETLETDSGDWVIANPVGFIDSASWSAIVLAILQLVLTFGSGASTLFRYRRAEAVERQQLKWLLYAAALFVVVFASTVVISDWAALPLVLDVLFALSIAAVPVAIAVAVLRFRLYDIDLVISRTLVYGALALTITGVYVAVVVGIGSLLSGDNETMLPFVATFIIAVVFQPLRRRLQKVANRVAYGRRATPYEALSDFSHRLSATDDNLLEQVVRSLADGTSAKQAAVWVRQGDVLVRSRTWPTEEPATEAEVAGIGVETIPGTDHTAWVTHEGERLGALTLRFPRGLQPTPTDERLMTELASGMGLALQNLMLTRSLRDRVEELRESRRRLVAAQDETRRRLERDLHDGAQQQLVALKVKLSLARRMAVGSVSPRAADILEGLNARPRPPSNRCEPWRGASIRRFWRRRDWDRRSPP
jgi:hypothetical protein